MSLKDRFFKGSIDEFIDSIIKAKTSQLKIKAHAINHAIDIISKTISKSEIMVYRSNPNSNKIEETIDEEYYKLNVQPNDNEIGTTFFYKVIKRYLGPDQEALIICFQNKLYLADSFNVTESLLLPKQYTNVKISDENGNSIVFQKVFNHNEVIHLTLKCSEIIKILDEYYEELGKLIGIASSHYKLSNSHKFRLKPPGGQPTLKDPITKKEVSYEEYKKKITRGLFDEGDAVILLSESFGLEKIDFGQSTSSEDWSKLEKKWTDKVAMSFNIPLDIFYGNKTDKSTSTTDFLTFGVIPHLQVLEDGLNSKIIGKDAYLKGEYIKINRFNMQHKDILDSATNMDKLFSNGYSHNEINKMIGMPRLDEDWADEHYITKNYQNAKVAMKGGDE